MITPGYVQTMARYNAWQNKQLSDVVQQMDQADLDQQRGAFFGSIQSTLSHLLWGDEMWMSRFDPEGGGKPQGGIGESAARYPDADGWAVARQACDDRILAWGGRVAQDELDGPLSWYSGAAGRDMSMPFGRLVAHFFNHQTHHRGQVHAMLTAAGQPAPVSDRFMMPKDD